MKAHLPGVYPRLRVDGGTIDYRASLTWKRKHIALGSFKTGKRAHEAYLEGMDALTHPEVTMDSIPKKTALPFEKYVILINYRDKGIYIPTPIYMQKRYFLYYLSRKLVYKFDIDDLFYYSSHKIMKRGKHLFVADYGSQINILNRYGIRSHAVLNRDYRFINGDQTDLRYLNIEIINRYQGVRRYISRGMQKFKTVIHVQSNYVVGHYETEEEAAIAYNKAADVLAKSGISTKFRQNYLEDLSASDYAEIYRRIPISPRVLHLHGSLASGRG